MTVRPLRRLVLAGLVLFPLTSARAQGSGYVPLDDPRLPLLEHLILRGAVRDPSPQVRPLVERDVVAALERARGPADGSDKQVAAGLAEAWRLPTQAGWWRFHPRLGAQAYSQARRDLLQPGGDGDMKGYADLNVAFGFGPVVIDWRPALENRLKQDPDWIPDEPYFEDHNFYRMVNAYGTVRWKWGLVHFGSVERNVGPPGVPGIPISNYAYPRTDLGFVLTAGPIRFESYRGILRDGVTDSGTVASRWWAMHRLSWRPSDGLQLALWESAVAVRDEGNVDAAVLNPFYLLFPGAEFGLGDRRNAILGGDATWRPLAALLLQGQAAIDDWSFDDANQAPKRVAFTLSAGGPLASSLSWRASYTLASSLAFRTFDPLENYVDASPVGIGRRFTDNEQLDLTVNVPVRSRWLVSPQLTYLRQGEGQLDQPFPSQAELPNTPAFIIGTARKTYQFAVGLSGQEGILGITALGGVRHEVNAGNVAGVDRTEAVGRLMVTIGRRWQGGLEP